MKYPLLLVICSLVFCCCEPENNPTSVTMKDGKTITVYSSQKSYLDKDEFVHRVSFSFPRPYKYDDVEEIKYLEDSTYTVNGYNQSFIGCWEIAKLGEWSRDYGLASNKVYYVATKVYTKYVSLPPNGLRIVPKLGGIFMGYRPDIEPRTFWVDNDFDAKVSILTTSTRYIGYDSEGNTIDCEIPSFINNKENKLTWRFLVRDDGWD